jgi:hypothetical protein
VALSFVPVVLPDDASAAVALLTTNEWPFHGSTRLSAERAASVALVADDV